jgi:hypothetical protein
MHGSLRGERRRGEKIKKKNEKKKPLTDESFPLMICIYKK